MHLKKRKESAAEFEKVLNIDQKFNEGIHLLLAAAYQELGDSKSAMSALEAGLQPATRLHQPGLDAMWKSGKPGIIAKSNVESGKPFVMTASPNRLARESPCPNIGLRGDRALREPILVRKRRRSER
jgi:hypothetical protein